MKRVFAPQQALFVCQVSELSEACQISWNKVYLKERQEMYSWKIVYTWYQEDEEAAATYWIDPLVQKHVPIRQEDNE